MAARSHVLCPIPCPLEATLKKALSHALDLFWARAASGQPRILVPIALFSSLSRQGLGTRIEGVWGHTGRDPFNQNFRKFRSKTEWIGSVQQEKFRKKWSTFRGSRLRCSVSSMYKMEENTALLLDCWQSGFLS